MRSLEQIAGELLTCSLTWEREAKIIGNVTAFELALLAVSRISTCPQCGADAGADIDCSTCVIIDALEAGG